MRNGFNNGDVIETATALNMQGADLSSRLVKSPFFNMRLALEIEIWLIDSGKCLCREVKLKTAAQLVGYIGKNLHWTSTD